MHPLNKHKFGNAVATSIKVHVNSGANANVVSVPVVQHGIGFATMPTAAFTNAGAGTGNTVTVHMAVYANPTIAAGGTGGSNGAVTLVGTTGTGTKVHITGTITNNTLASISGISTAGDYTALPSALAAEPVTGGSLANCTLNFTNSFGVLSVAVGGTGNGLYSQDVGVSLSGGSPTTIATLGTPVLDGGVTETGWIVKQLGARKYRITLDDNATHSTYKLAPVGVAAPATGYFNILAYPVVNGVVSATPEHVVRLGTRHITTYEGNRYIWTMNNAVTTTGYALIETN